MDTASIATGRTASPQAVEAAMAAGRVTAVARVLVTEDSGRP